MSGSRPVLNSWLTRRTARHTLGIVLLLFTVCLWTASSFLASTMFADDSFDKPYFITYLNSCFFASLLIVEFLRRLRASGWSLNATLSSQAGSKQYVRVQQTEEDDPTMLKPVGHEVLTDGKLNVRQTARLGFQFGLLWFSANYFVAACLAYTSVASSTIFSSTSSIWTLIFGALLGVEIFTFRKLLGVLASFAGIILTSSVDLSGTSDESRGAFPYKSRAQIAVGDAMALFSAILYGIYATTMKKRIGDESRVSMPLFFGFVGLFGAVVLLPGLPVLHFTGIEEFQLPPNRRVVVIILVNAIISLTADIAWAYAMLLISPLVVTVGLSLTIPLSLVGQMIINSQTSSAIYWVGAVIVLLSFLFINYESKEVESDPATTQDVDRPILGDHEESGAG